MLTFASFSIFEIIGLSVLSISLLIQLIYFYGIFGRLAFFRSKKINTEQQPLSVVIAARNEYQNLKQNLPLILNQDYPNFEVIVVNDNSEDETESLLKQFKHEHSHLKIVNIEHHVNFFSGKKFPLSIGIKSASNDLVVLTDADCQPLSEHWLSNMQEGFSDDTEIVLGVSPYKKKSSLLNAIIRWDTMHVAIQYISFALMGMPYMGVGRNLAYKKELFFKNKGFTQHYKVSSGDDDLFINQVANSSNTKVQIAASSHTVSDAEMSYSSWLKQKRRHLTTGKYYKNRFKLLLGLYSLSSSLFYLFFVLLLFFSKQYYLIGGLFAIRMFSQLLIFKLCSKKMELQQGVIGSVVFDFILTIMNPFVAFSNLIQKQNQWK